MQIENLDSVIEKIKEQLPKYVANVIGKEPGKAAFNCVFPEHNDTSPSTHLNPKEDFKEGKCFGCGRSFDIFVLASAIEGLPTFGSEFITETVVSLAERYDIPLNWVQVNEQDAINYSALRAIKTASLYVSSLEQKTFTKSVEDYISEHNWSKAELGKLGVGVGTRDSFIDYMKSHGYTVPYLNSLGLLNLIEEDRLIFTLFDQASRPIGFACRTFGAGPKWINSPASSIYNKSEVLYGVNWARQARKKPLYIFEGYGDVLTARFSGIDNCCCVCGTALTVEQLLLISKMGFQSVNLCLDFDQAGRDAITKAVHGSVSEVRDLSVNIITSDLKEDSDPDSFIRVHGVDKFLALEKVSPFSWTLKQLTSNGLSGGDLANKLTSVIASEPNVINRELFIKELSVISDISQYAIEAEVRKLTNKNVEERRQAQNAIVQRLALDIDKEPLGALTASYNALQALENISKDYDVSTVTNASFISLIDLQDKEELSRKENSSIGLQLPLLQLFQEKLSGGDDWKRGTLFLLGGLENTGKSSFLSYWGMNIASCKDNDPIVIVFTIDDTGPQILPKLICAADCIVNGGLIKDNPLTIGHIRNISSIPNNNIALRRKNAYEFVKDLANGENLILKDSKDGKTLAYLDSVIRYFRRRHPSRNIIVTIDNTHNLSDYSHMEDKTERYKRIANTMKDMAVKYDAMFFSTVEYRKSDTREKKDIKHMMPDNNEIAETRALKYLASFIGHLYNDMHSRPNMYDTFHLDPYTGFHSPRIIMSVGKTKFNGYKGEICFDFFPASSAFVPVENKQVKLERVKYLESQKQEDEEQSPQDETW